MTIKILGVTYEVKEEIQISKDNFVMGEVEYAKQLIRIDESLNHEVKQVTLLHEIIHALLFAYGFHEENANENLVQSLAAGLHQVFSENLLFA